MGTGSLAGTRMNTLREDSTVTPSPTTWIVLVE
jgi:hypothetical protein